MKGKSTHKFLPNLMLLVLSVARTTQTTTNWITASRRRRHFCRRLLPRQIRVPFKMMSAKLLISLTPSSPNKLTQPSPPFRWYDFGQSPPTRRLTSFVVGPLPLTHALSDFLEERARVLSFSFHRLSTPPSHACLLGHYLHASKLSENNVLFKFKQRIYGA